MQWLSVIIADDDWLVRKDLVGMVDWKALGFSIAATAASGEETLSYVEEYHPFLLITGIRMLGELNGLDVIEQAHEKYPRMKFLVISSYDDFHYLKRAMASGVIDYLLKTDITPNTLTAKLLDAKDAYSRENRMDASAISRELESYLREGTNEESRDVPPSIEAFPGLMPLGEKLFHFVVCGKSLRFSRHQREDYDQERAQLSQIISDIYPYVTDYDARPVGCLLGRLIIIGLSADLVSTFGLRDFSNSLRYRYGGTKSLLQFYTGHPVTIEAFCALMKRQLPIIYYSLHFPREDYRSVNLDELSRDTYVPVSDDFPFQALVMEQDHLEKNILLLKQYMERCIVSRDIRMLQRFFQDYCIHLELQTGYKLDLPDTFFAETPEGFQKWIFNRLEDCILLRTQGVNHEYSPAVAGAIRFMTQNYAIGELSSAQIAEAVGLSVNRLGVLMKHEAGRTINEYLAQLRIDRAVELLEKTNLKIYEIAERCGYRSSQYFSQVFYQKTGRKPIDYRRGGKA